MRKWTVRVTVGAASLAGLWLFSAGTAQALTAEESCFTSKINGARASAGRASLTTHSELVAIARRHSKRMADSGSIFHNGNLANEAPDGWQSLGENVGMGPSCDAIHQAFMNSASHRANILDPDFNFVGVGVVIASDGTIFVTEVFMQASPPAATQPAPTTTSTTPKTTTPKTTTKATTKTSTTKPAAPAAPPPPPPPPPGSKVKGETRAYFDVIEKEAQPSEADLAAHEAFLREQAKLRALRDKETLLRARRTQSIFWRASSFLAAVLSGSV